MESLYNFNSSIQLPPGFRFHPTDEELITRYLSPKVLDSSFNSIAIGEVDLNKVEPWDLPWKAKFGEQEWYFFSVRDRKYQNGSRTNRATRIGYWKATGKDKEIFVEGKLGMKKTLVFYRGRAPKGEKTNWVMHEYRIQGNNSFQNLYKIDMIEWVICRVFKKNDEGKKVHISQLGTDKDSRLDENRNTAKAEGSHVTCFSNSDSIFLSPSMPDIGISTTNTFNHEVGFKPYDHESGFKIDDDDDQGLSIDYLWNY